MVVEERVEIGMRKLRASRQSLAEKSLRDFTKQAWHVIEPARFVEGKHIDGICDTLEAVTRGDIKNLVINIPPRFAKSLLVCVFWFCWTWVRFPYTRWLFSSYSQQLAKRDSLKCRNVITSDWYQRRWGAAYQIRDDQNEKQRFENTRTGFRIATSVGGMGVGEGGDYIVTDDPHKTSDVDSELKRQNVRDWYAGTMMTRGNDARETRRVIVKQRLHEGDLSQWAIDQGWTTLIIPQEFEADRKCIITVGDKLIFEDWRTVEGELICPERFGPEQVAEAKRSLGAYWYAGQHQQRPSPADGEMFKRSNFRYFRIMKLPADARVPRIHAPSLGFIFELRNGDKVKRWYAWDCWWFQVVDTSEGKSKGNKNAEAGDSAFTALGTYCVTPDNELLVWEVVRERLGFNDQYEFIRNQKQRYDCIDFQAVEKASTGSALIELAIADGEPFEVLTAHGSKVQRARASQAMYTSSRVYHRMPSQCEDSGEWLAAYEAEHLKFPNSKFKDQVDIGAYAAMLVTKKGGPMMRDPDDEADEDDLDAIAEENERESRGEGYTGPEDDFEFDDDDDDGL